MDKDFYPLQPTSLCLLFAYLFGSFKVTSEAVVRRCSLEKVFLEISKKFTGKHLCQSLFLNKVAGLRPATLLKKRLWHRCFPVYFFKISKNTFFYRTPPVAASVI